MSLDWLVDIELSPSIGIPCCHSLPQDSGLNVAQNGAGECPHPVWCCVTPAWEKRDARRNKPIGTFPEIDTVWNADSADNTTFAFYFPCPLLVSGQTPQAHQLTNITLQTHVTYIPNAFQSVPHDKVSECLGS